MTSKPAGRGRASLERAARLRLLELAGFMPEEDDAPSRVLWPMLGNLVALSADIGGVPGMSIPPMDMLPMEAFRHRLLPTRQPPDIF